MKKGTRSTHCRRGHEKTPDNRTRSNGCKVCNKMKSKEYRDRWVEKNPNYFADHHLQRHSLSLEKYDQLLEEQGGGCAICGEPPKEKRLAVDHDHSCCSGQYACEECVRGLLCQSCNQAIGLMKEDTTRLSKAINYLNSRKK